MRIKDSLGRFFLLHATWICGLHLLVTCILTIQILDRYASGGDEWQSGDWLINYSDGFTRRGLSGEVILLLARLTGSNVLLVLTCFQLAIIGIFLFNLNAIYQVFWHRLCNSNPRFYMFLLLSPSGLLFLLQNPNGNFRKEIIGLTLVVHMCRQQLSTKKLGFRSAITNLIFFTIAVLCWEPNLVTLPIFLIFRKRFNLEKLAYRVFLLLLSVISCVLFIFSFAFHGKSSTSDKICNSLDVSSVLSPKICNGAIQAMSWDFTRFLEGATLSHPLRALGFGLLAGLALFPFRSILSKEKEVGRLMILQGMLIFSFNILAADTGRSIYSMFITSLSVLIVFLNSSNQTISNRFYHWCKRTTRIKYLVTIFSYTFLWWLPFSGESWRGFIPFQWVIDYITT